MNILFISYTEVSLRGGRVRTVAMLRALADAGHRVDIIAPVAYFPPHPHIRVLEDEAGRNPYNRIRLGARIVSAVGRGEYDAIHAVDAAVFLGDRLGRWKKIPLVYNASRRFSGSVATGLSWNERMFPKRYRRLEQRAVAHSEAIFSPCSALSADLLALDKEAKVVQLEGVPMQSLHSREELDRNDLYQRYGIRSGPMVVCGLMPVATTTLRNLFISLRKVVDALPDVTFFFRGGKGGQAEKMATNLDISDQCIFLPASDADQFLSVLSVADAALMIPRANSRYMHSIVYTLLQSGTPLVAVQDAAYDEVLTDKTAVRVLDESDAIAEGLLRVIQEPLFSLAIAMGAQQVVAERYTYSSYKHKVRMTCHQVFKHE